MQCSMSDPRPQLTDHRYDPFLDATLEACAQDPFLNPLQVVAMHRLVHGLLRCCLVAIAIGMLAYHPFLQLISRALFTFARDS